jgi:hypothetical protein
MCFDSRAHRLDTRLDTIMARAKRSELSGEEKRLAKPVRGKPYWEVLGGGVGIGYRRTRGAGTWVARKSDRKGGYSTEKLGRADDYEDANGDTVLSWAEAQQAAFQWARQQSGERAQLTVGEATNLYEAELRIKGVDLGNVRRLRRRLGNDLARRTVAGLTPEDLATWRTGLCSDMRPESVNRTCTPLKAALNLAADRRPAEITNRSAWRDGLKPLEAQNAPRNVILNNAVVQRIVSAAYEVGEQFGLLVDVAATTGGRYSQLARLNVVDLQDGPTPRLMVPSSRKGRRGRTNGAMARHVLRCRSHRGSRVVFGPPQRDVGRTILYSLSRAASAGVEVTTPACLREQSPVRIAARRVGQG